VRVVLSTWGSRGDVEPLAGLAVGLRELGAEVRVCAPPDEEFAALLARVGVPLVPLGPTVRSVVAGTKPPTAQDAFRLAPELVAARFDTLTAAAEGCDALLATGLMPAGARDVAEKLGIRYVYACFHIFGLPSRHFSPGARPGKPSPQEETDNRVLWEQDAQRVNALYGEALNSHRAAIGLPPVDNVRDYVFTDQPWLAADATLCPSQGMTDLDIVQTGAWILPDDRPLPQELEAFLARAHHRCTWAWAAWPRTPPKDIARVAIEASRAHGRRDSSPAAGRHAPGGGPPDRGPAVLGRPSGRAGHRLGSRRPDSDLRLPVRRAQNGPGARDPSTSESRGRHDPHRRGDGGRDAAARRDQPRAAASVRVNHAGSSSQGKCPAPSCTANTACSKRPAHSAAFRGGSPTSYSPASNSTGFQDHCVRSS
jgi:hypothetical protein